MTTRRAFAIKVLGGAGLLNIPRNQDILIAGMIGEDSHAAYNPLDTELPAAGATLFNTSGVRDYVDLDQGVAATVATLELGAYREVRAMFADPDLPALTEGEQIGVCNAFEQAWSGDKGFTLYSQVYAEDDLIAGGEVEIYPTTAAPPAEPIPTASAEQVQAVTALVKGIHSALSSVITVVEQALADLGKM